MATVSEPVGFVDVARMDGLPHGQPIAVHVDGTAIVVVRVGDRCYAVGAECPHAGGPLGAGRLVGSHGLECPLHGAVFDVRSGAVLRGPARRPLICHEVDAAGAVVRVRLSRSADVEGVEHRAAGHGRGSP